MLLLIAMLFLKRRKLEQNVVIGVLYVFSVTGYLLSSWPPLSESNFFILTAILAWSIPYFFWMLTKAIFNDRFVFNKYYLLGYVSYIVLNIGIYYIAYYQRELLDTPPLVGKLSQTLSLTLIILGLVESIKGRQADLVESRVKFRNAFVIISAVVIILTLVVELSYDSTFGRLEDVLNLIQKIGILVICFVLFYHIVDVRSGFFFKQRPTDSENKEVSQALYEPLTKLMEKEKIYLKEGLTIRLLADQMHDQEYKVRQLINQSMGFRNFNDFLNSYRIKDACKILEDATKTDRTILEIAYSLGYSSIGPFNKAFKHHTNTTPTQYRKIHCSN